MSERPTPETNALASEHRGAVIWPDFARKLERERDQFQQIALDAERELKRMEQLVVVKRSNNRSIDARNKRLERERDEAREERDQYRGLLIRLHNDLFVHHGGQAVREFKELFREENYN